MSIVYPEYFNKELSLKEGRKVPLEIAVKNPSINNIANALKKLKIQHIVEKDKSYPGRWYEKNGRVIIETDQVKRELIKEIAINMKSSRK